MVVLDQNVQWNTNITKLIKNLLEGLELQWRTSLFINSNPSFGILFENLCTALLGNKLESAPYLIIMSWKASENWDHHSFLIEIWYLVIGKAIKTRWNIVTCPKIEISWNVLPFFWGDLPTSHALWKNYKKIRTNIFKVTQFWGLSWNQLHDILCGNAHCDNRFQRYPLPTCRKL